VGEHVVYGTQNVTKDSVPIAIRANIEGRLVFKVNEAGGYQAAGSAARTVRELEVIPGRGIWRGPDNKPVVLQVYYSSKKWFEKFRGV
jgi:DNA segregation ATPase FtsK/SpoIIIE-like protein